jgi:hypothetical protein
MLFRRHRSPYEMATVSLRAIEPNAEYQVSLSSDYRPGPATRMKGQELQSLSVRIAEMPGSILLRYQQVEQGTG